MLAVKKIATTEKRRTSEPTEPESFYGFEPLPARGAVVFNELIDKLREEGIE